MAPTTQPDPNAPPSNLTGPRYRRGILSLMGGQPNNSLIGSLYGAWQQHQQNQQAQQNATDQQMIGGMDQTIAGAQPNSGAGATGDFDDALSPETAAQPSVSVMGDALDLASDAFAGGKMVTSPTIALLGENGPEKVVPMGPSDKVSGAMLTDQPIKAPATLGGTARARYSHVGKPNALARTKPLSADLPLKPNTAVR